MSSRGGSRHQMFVCVEKEIGQVLGRSVSGRVFVALAVLWLRVPGGGDHAGQGSVVG